MLSDREEQELELIERGLQDDSRLASSLRDGPRRPLYRRPRVVRTAIAVGLFLMVAGLMLAAIGLALQGLLLAGASYLWLRWKVEPAAPGPAASERPAGPGSGEWPPLPRGWPPVF